MRLFKQSYVATLFILALCTTTSCGARAAADTYHAQDAKTLVSSSSHELSFEEETDQASPQKGKKKSKHRRHSKRKKTHSSEERACSTQSRRHGTSGRSYSYKPITLAEGTPNLIRTVVDHGQKLLGHRYRATGIAKWPLDCSGFVSYIYSLEGIKIPRSSGAIAVYANKIKDPQPGDLLFFKGRNKRQSRVGHVAMVVSNDNGNIQMMHSSCGLGIVIESYNNSSYYTSRYLGAGRLPEVVEHWGGQRDSTKTR